MHRVLCFFLLVIILAFPAVAFAYLSPSTISLIAASASSIVVVVGILVAYVVIVFTWLREHKKTALILLSVPLVAVSWFGYTTYQEYGVLKEINTFEDRIDPRNTSWDAFFAEYAATHPGIDPDTFFTPDGSLSRERISALIPDISFTQAREQGYTLLGVYCDPIGIPGEMTSCDLVAPIFTDPTDEKAVHEIMSGMGVDKEEPLVLFCDYGLRSSLAAVMLSQYGYNVVGQATLNREKDTTDVFRLFGMNDDTIIHPFDTESHEQYIFFIIGTNYALFDPFSELLRTKAKRGEFTILSIRGEHFSEDGRNMPPTKIPIQKFSFMEDSAHADLENEPDFDIHAALDGDVRIACLTLLNCLSVRSYLEHIGRPTAVLYCVMVDSEC